MYFYLFIFCVCVLQSPALKIILKSTKVLASNYTSSTEVFLMQINFAAGKGGAHFNYFKNSWVA